MAVKLRLMRMGKTKQPTYRIVAADSRSPRDGRFIESIGTYAPRDDPSSIKVDRARAIEWLVKGAQPTETVRKILQIDGAWGEYSSAQPVKATKVRTRPERAKPVKAAPAKRPAPAAAPVATDSADGQGGEQ